jgi:hypothetical protein
MQFQEDTKMTTGNIAIIVGIIGIFGTISGILITQIFNYYSGKRSRKDKYLFTLIETKFKIYQEAYYNAEVLKRLIHDNDSEKIRTINKIKDWFNKNNLYLRPDIRKDFEDCIADVSMYPIHRDVTLSAEGEDAKDKDKELEELFGKIMAINRRIQKSLDIYYDL